MKTVLLASLLFCGGFAFAESNLTPPDNANDVGSAQQATTTSRTAMQPGAVNNPSRTKSTRGKSKKNAAVVTPTKNANGKAEGDVNSGSDVNPGTTNEPVHN